MGKGMGTKGMDKDRLLVLFKESKINDSNLCYIDKDDLGKKKRALASARALAQFTHRRGVNS